MRYAIFSDIHGNREAWRRVLADIRELKADVLVCLGDVVGYGPLPEEVLNEIREVTDNFVLGNHDAAAVGMIDVNWFNPHARSVIEWTIRQLSDQSRMFLSTVPLAMEAEDILFVHAESEEPGRFGYITDMEEAYKNFASSTQFITFVGHTHEPTIFALNSDGSVNQFPDADGQLDENFRYIVNVGSVGEPRNPEDVRARYVIYDSDTREVYFRRIEFNIDAYRRDLARKRLEITPYFIQVVDQQIETNEAELAMQSLGQAAIAANRRGPARLNVPQGAASGKRKPKPKPMASQLSQPSKAPLFLSMLGLIVALLGVGWLMFGDRLKPKPGPEIAGSPAVEVADEQVAPAAEPPAPSEDPQPNPAEDQQLLAAAGGDSSPNVDVAVAPGAAAPENMAKKKKKGAAPEMSEPEPAPTAPPEPDPAPKAEPEKIETVAYWRMERDSAGPSLVDSLENFPLAAAGAPAPLGALAPSPVPLTGETNEAALSKGVWSESAPDGAFQLSKTRSFTVEGWILADRTPKPILLAGTRSGPASGSQGWHVILQPPTSDFPTGQMNFLYDNGPELTFALSQGVNAANLKPHHWAAIWDHDQAGESGEMRLYLDGVQVAATLLDHSAIADSQANPFQIGANTNPPRLAFDEVRFTHGALKPVDFLSAGMAPPGVIFAHHFEEADANDGKLQGMPVDQSAEKGQKWRAAEGWSADGSKFEVGKANALVPFSPEEGKLYQLSLDVSLDGGGPNWMAIGFTEQARLDDAFFLSGASPWLMLRQQTVDSSENRGMGYLADRRDPNGSFVFSDANSNVPA
ncbi:MAG: metallophosphoesterase family protein [Verrucomicrobiota bacterium]